MKKPYVVFPGGGELAFTPELLARAVEIKDEIMATPGSDLLPRFDVWQAVYEMLVQEGAR